jgi:rhombotail lipoprotein
MKTRRLLACLALFALGSMVGCAQTLPRNSSSASFTQTIEPIKDSPQISRKTPLILPVSVAIVTVPSKQPGDKQVPNTTLRLASEKLKQQLLGYPKYIRSVAVVQSDDLEGKISLARIQALYSADIAIVLSYQQDQRASQKGVYGLLDVTIVGAFLVPGVEITTSSLIDGKVIHIPSSAIIFKASGTDERKSHSTSWAQNASFSEESINSILAATGDFGNSLAKKLDKFDNYDLSQAVPVSTLTENDAEPANNYWKKVDTYKTTTGGGAFGFIPLLISAAVCCAAWRRR